MSAVLVGLIDIVEFLVGYLPHQVIVVSGSYSAATVAGDLLNWLGVLAGFLPIELYVEISLVFVAMMPVMFTLLAAAYIYDHLPKVAGTGT